VVLEVLKNQITGVEACRKYGIKQSELEAWTNRFLEAGENGLRANPRDEVAEYEARIKDLQAKVGELVLERDILKKADAIQREREKTS
jgi:transposase-like protein